MCTAITYQGKSHYFGRNLDFEHNFGECVVITPRNYPFYFRREKANSEHYAIIGMAVTDNDYPLYFDGTNEKGLSMAGLYFPDNAVYLEEKEGYFNITPFELIPWILCQCANMEDALKILDSTNLINLPYSSQYPLTPLHWLIADKDKSVTLEPRENGLRIYDNPIGVLTNNPPFPYHLYHLNNYLNLTREEATNRFAPQYDLHAYSRGMGAIGLPGDLSSSSRFIRAAFTKLNSVCEATEESCVSQFFHILGSVAQQRGCVKVGNGFEKTIYSSCCNTDTGTYYYTTYDNSQVSAVSLQNKDMDSAALSSFPLIDNPQIRYIN